MYKEQIENLLDDLLSVGYESHEYFVEGKPEAAKAIAEAVAQQVAALNEDGMVALQRHKARIEELEKELARAKVLKPVPQPTHLEDEIPY